MAIYHFHASAVSRGSGKSVVESAAYNARTQLFDERRGRHTRDYSEDHEQECLWTGFYAPKDVPDWAQHRSWFWNAVEKIEKHPRACLAREIKLALPHELTLEQNRWLLQDFIRETFTRKGLVVDAAIHAPHVEGDQRNIHAHVLICERIVTRDGFARTKHPQFRGSARIEALEHWREDWAQLANRHLERHGFEQRIDHRTLEAQGLDREPTHHLGPKATRMERAGMSSDKGELNRSQEARDHLQEQRKRELAEVEAELRILELSERQREVADRQKAYEREQALAWRRTVKEKKLREALRMAFKRFKAQALRDGGSVELADKVEAGLAQEAADAALYQRQMREQAYCFVVHQNGQAERVAAQEGRDDWRRIEAGVLRLAKDAPDWRQQEQDFKAGLRRFKELPEDEREAMKSAARETAELHPDEVRERIRAMWHDHKDAFVFRHAVEQAGLILARGDSINEPAPEQEFLIVDGRGWGYTLGRVFGEGRWVIRERMAEINPNLLPTISQARELQKERAVGGRTRWSPSNCFNETAESQRSTPEGLAGRYERVAQWQIERMERQHEAEQVVLRHDHESAKHSDRLKPRVEQVERAQERAAEAEALRRQQEEQRTRLVEEQQWRRESYARAQLAKNYVREQRQDGARPKTAAQRKWERWKELERENSRGRERTREP